MRIESKGGDSGDMTLIPMKALYERIDQVRRTRKDLPTQLRNIAEEIPSNWTRKSLRLLAGSIEQNASAAQLVARFPEHCWLLTLQSSAATTDALTSMLEQSAFQHSLRMKKIRTVAYPIVLLIISAAFLLAVVTFLIPPFDEMYQEFGMRLPAPTMALIGLSRLINGQPFLSLFLLCILIAGISGGLWIWIGDSSLKRSLFATSVHGPAMRQSLAKVSLQVAELSDEGIGLSQALKIAAESNPDVAMRSLVGDLAVQASHDASHLQKTRAAMIFPPNFLFALQPSQSPSTPNTTMLRELAASYRDLSVRRKDWIAFALGQITVIGVGLMIAFVVVALFAPLVSLVTALS